MVAAEPSVPLSTRPHRSVGTLVSLILLPIGSVAGAAPLNLAETAKFNIPAEPLATALLQFSSQAHIQIATSGSEVGRAQSPGAVGVMSIGSALTNLLTGTGFAYRISGERSIAVFLTIPAAPATGPPADTASPNTDTNNGIDHRGEVVMPRRSLLARLAGFIVTTIAAMSGVPVHGQQADTSASAPATGELAEIVVTAERRQIDLQKSALNISVVTADELSSAGIRTARDLLDSVPGLDMTFGNVNDSIGLYGLQTGGGDQRADAVMSYSYGGVPLARQTAAGSAMYDVDRVEVLKGPQGTLYGRNATVGALNVVIAKPKLGEFSGSGGLTLGNYATVNTTGAVNIPLGERWALRAAFQTTRHDGYFTNGYDDANNFGARASLLYQPSEDLSVLFLLDSYRNRAKGPGNTMTYYFNDSQKWVMPDNPWWGFGAAGSCTDQRYCPSFASVAVGGINARVGLNGSPATGFGDLSANGLGTKSVWGNDGFNNEDQTLYSTEVNYHTGIGNLTVQAAHVDTKIDYLSYNTLLFYNRTKAYQNSLEARLASDNNGRLKWLVGGFYFYEHQNARQDNMQAPGWAIINTPNLTDQNHALFGDVTFSVTDRLRLLGGLRYTSETKQQDGWTSITGVSAANMTLFPTFGATCFAGSVTSPVVLFPGRPSPSNVCLIPNTGNPTFTDTSWKAGVEYDVSATSMLYTTVKTGFRSGGFTAGTNNTYLPEKLTAYEIGSRNRFFNNQLQTNVTAFYWDYKDEQFAVLRPYYLNGFIVGQAGYPFNGNGKLQGVETDIRALITNNDTIGFNALYNEGKIIDTPNIVNSQGVTGPLHNIDRYNLPKWTLSASYNHSFNLPNNAKLDFGVNGHHETATIARLADPALLRAGDYKDAYTKLNADLTYAADGGKWSIQAYVQNITNVAVIGFGAPGQVGGGVWFQPSMNQANSRSVGLEPPRTYGIRITSKF